MNSKKILSIEHEDGSITISLDGKSLTEDDADTNPPDWFDNLADRLPDGELNRISTDLLRGVDDDLESRNERVRLINRPEHGLTRGELGLRIGPRTGAPDTRAEWHRDGRDLNFARLRGGRGGLLGHLGSSRVSGMLSKNE